MPNKAPTSNTSALINREAWLQAATRILAQRVFTPAGFDVPQVQVSVGFASGGLRSRAIGQCWSKSGAKDGLNHIFISPSLGEAYEALDTLTHELIHAVDDCKHKHGKEFKSIALAIGMKGPMRSASAGPELKPLLENILATLPPYPHAKLSVSHKVTISIPPPKARCAVCGYRVTIPKRFIDFGPPICPKDKQEMEPLGHWG